MNEYALILESNAWKCFRVVSCWLILVTSDWKCVILGGREG